MKTSDIVGKINSSDLEESMLDRDSSMGGGVDLGAVDDDDDFSDFFSDDDDSSSTGNTDFNTVGSQSPLLNSTGVNPLGGGSMLGTPNSFNPLGMQVQQPQAQQPQKGAEDVMLEVASSAAKGSISYMKEVGKSFSGLKARFWTKYGSNMIIVGGVSCVVGVVSLFVLRKVSYNFLVGGILDLITGVGCLTFFYDRAKLEGGQEIESFQPLVQEPLETGEDEVFSLDEDDEDDDIMSMLGDDEEEDDDIFGSLLGDDEDDTDNTESDDLFNSLFGDDVNTSTSTSTLSEEEVLNNIKDAEENLENINDGMLYTRQYLYDKIVPILENINADYDTMKEIGTESEEFKSLNHVVSVAGKQVANSQEDVPYLISASENMLYIKLDVQRTKAIKSVSNINNLCEEIVNILKVDEKTGSIPEENRGIYATGISVADKVIIKVYKGEGTMVSIKDIILKNKDFFMDSSNKIPCVIGIDGDGQPVLRDFKDIESILMTGFPRSGKTWATLSMITQLAMWNPPSDVQFYICDPKNKISDFKNFSLPHVRKFIYKDSDILAMMKNLVQVEGERRKELVGDIDKVNIWDFKAQNPDIELPIIYVIIDEVVSLADRMDKDTKKDFQGYLRQLITQLPAVGIRAILVPHEIKNDIINKTTTNSIPCRFSVKGDAAHIKHNVLGDDSSVKFNHVLRNKGDMAVKLGEDVTFIRSAVLSNSNDKNLQIFSFLRKLWCKLEPNSVKGSRAEETLSEQELKEMRENTIESVDDTEIDFDELTEGVMEMSTVDEIDDFFNGGV